MSSQIRPFSLPLMVVAVVLLSAATVAGQNPIFYDEQIYPSYGYETQGVAIADFNNDGIPDIAIASGCDPSTYPRCYAGDVSIWLGNGDGTFHSGRGAASPPPNIRALLAADFNHDGNMDLAILAYCNDDQCDDSRGKVYIFFGDGTGFLVQHTWAFTSGNHAVGIAAGDFDGDGNLDLAIVNLSGSVTILLGNGTGGGTIPIAGIPWAVTVADLNGDGIQDLAIANECGRYNCKRGSVVILIGNGDGTFQKPRYHPVRGDALWVAAADMNRDGKMDLIAGGYHGTYVLLGRGDGTFRNHVFPYTGDVAMVADVNNDGYPDIIKWGTVLLGSAKGTFTPQGFEVHASGESMALGDFNGDGYLDVAFSDYGSDDGSVSALLNRGK